MLNIAVILKLKYAYSVCHALTKFKFMPQKAKKIYYLWNYEVYLILFCREIRGLVVINTAIFTKLVQWAASMSLVKYTGGATSYFRPILEKSTRPRALIFHCSITEHQMITTVGFGRGVSKIVLMKVR